MTSNNFKIISIIVISVLSVSASYSSPKLSVNSFFTTGEARLAVKGGFLTSVTLSGKGSVHTHGVENTFPVRNSFLPVSSSGYDMVAVEKGFFQMEDSIFNRRKIYGSLSDFSALKGMVYYSITEGGSIPLIIDSYSTSAMENYATGNSGGAGIPEKRVAHFAIRDNRLGLLSFRSELISGGGDFIMINTSTGTSSKFGMKIFDPGDYLVYKFFIYDSTYRGYFFYSAQYMKVRSGVLNKFNLLKPESFGNRVRAEYIHFLKSIGVDRSAELAAFK